MTQNMAAGRERGSTADPKHSRRVDPDTEVTVSPAAQEDASPAPPGASVAFGERAWRSSNLEIGGGGGGRWLCLRGKTSKKQGVFPRKYEGGGMGKENSPFSCDRIMLCSEYINLAFADCRSIVAIFGAKILYLLARVTKEG